MLGDGDAAESKHVWELCLLGNKSLSGRQTLYKCLTNNLKYEHKSFNEGKVGHGLLQSF